VLQILDGLDGSGKLKFGDEITVSDFRTNGRCTAPNQAQIDDVTYSLPYPPVVEVYGYYEGTPMIIDCAPGYVRNLSADDLIFAADVLEAHEGDLTLRVTSTEYDRYNILTSGQIVFVDVFPCYEQHICPVDIPLSQGDKVDVRGSLFSIAQPGYSNVQQPTPYIYVRESQHYVKKITTTQDIKFQGVVVQIYGGDYDVKVTVPDSSGKLKAGDRTWVTVDRQGQVIGIIQVGSNVEVYGELGGCCVPANNGYQINVYKSYHYIKLLQVIIASVTLDRSPPTTTQTGLFVSLPPKPPEGLALYWLSGFGVWALIKVQNPTTSDFDGYLNVYLIDSSGGKHDDTKGAIHVAAGKEEKYYAPIYYHDILSIKNTKTGIWHMHFELRKGTIFPLSQLIDEKVFDINVAGDTTPILPLNAKLSAGTEVAVNEFLISQPSKTAELYKKYYDLLNLIFSLLQAVNCGCKSDPTEAYGLDDILPPPSAIPDPRALTRLIDASASLATKTNYLGNNQYKITITYTVSASTLPPPDENVVFVPFYDRVHVHLYLPNGLQIMDNGGAFAVAPTNDGRQMVSWFDGYADKLLTSYGLPYPGYQVSHSVIVSVSNQCLCDYPFDSVGYFDVGPYSRRTVKSDLPIIDYDEWVSNPNGIAWILFATKDSQGSLSVMPGTSGQLEAIKVSSNSTILKVVNNPDAGSITLDLSGPDGTRGFTRIEIPRDIVEVGGGSSNLVVLLDGKHVPFNIQESGSSFILTVSYTQSAHVLEVHYGKPVWTFLIKQHLLWIVGAVAVSFGIIMFVRKRRSGPRVKEVIDRPTVA